jgi:hypothetical protein
MKYGTKSKRNINKAPGKIVGKEEIPQKNIWFDEECQKI